MGCRFVTGSQRHRGGSPTVRTLCKSPSNSGGGSRAFDARRILRNGAGLLFAEGGPTRRLRTEAEEVLAPFTERAVGIRIVGPYAKGFWTWSVPGLSISGSCRTAREAASKALDVSLTSIRNRWKRDDAAAALAGLVRRIERGALS